MQILMTNTKTGENTGRRPSLWYKIQESNYSIIIRRSYENVHSRRVDGTWLSFILGAFYKL